MNLDCWCTSSSSSSSSRGEIMTKRLGASAGLCAFPKVSWLLLQYSAVADCILILVAIPTFEMFEASCFHHPVVCSRAFASPLAVPLSTCSHFSTSGYSRCTVSKLLHAPAALQTNYLHCAPTHRSMHSAAEPNAMRCCSP
jgi:hypothetical protein